MTDRSCLTLASFLCSPKFFAQEQNTDQVHCLALEAFEKLGRSQITVDQLCRDIDFDELCLLLVHPGSSISQKLCLTTILNGASQHSRLDWQCAHVVATLAQLLLVEDECLAVVVCKCLSSWLDTSEHTAGLLADQCVFHRLLEASFTDNGLQLFPFQATAKLAQSSVAPPEYLCLLFKSLVIRWILTRNRSLVQNLTEWLRIRPSLLQVSARGCG